MNSYLNILILERLSAFSFGIIANCELNANWKNVNSWEHALHRNHLMIFCVFWLFAYVIFLILFVR